MTNKMMKMMNNVNSKIEDRQGVELEHGKGKIKVFSLLYFDPLEIWIDIKPLGHIALLCMMSDGVMLKEAKVGAKGRITRNFVNIEWCINDWGTDEKTIEALKLVRANITKDAERLKEKYYK